MFLTACFLFTFSHAQQLVISADRDKVLIGEQIELQVKLQDVAAAYYYADEWPVIDSTPHLVIVKKSGIDTIDINGLTTYIQKLTITSFDSGHWTIGPLNIALQERATGKKKLVLSDTLGIDILPVDITDMQDYHDIKDIIEVHPPPDYSLIVIIASGLVILACIIWWFKTYYKRKKTQPVKPAYKGTPLQQALLQLEKLNAERPSSAAEYKAFYTALTGIVKEYFFHAAGIKTNIATTDDLMVLAAVYLQDEKIRTSFYQSLRLADAVKFAKYIPDEEQHSKVVGIIGRCLQHVDDIIQRTRKTND